jgi:uncharacterized damage-inducible protein DinB
MHHHLNPLHRRVILSEAKYLYVHPRDSSVAKNTLPQNDTNKGIQMNIQNIHLMYEYNYWASGRILSAAAKVTEAQLLASAEFPYGGLRGTLVHIIDAEYGWRGLFENNKFNGDLNPEDFPDLKSITERFQMEEQAMRAYLNGLTDADMDSHKKYIADNGEPRDRILWHCLYHVVNHGTQHRSEAAAMLTSYDTSPGDLDFTVFLNQFKPNR